MSTARVRSVFRHAARISIKQQEARIMRPRFRHAARQLPAVLAIVLLAAGTGPAHAAFDTATAAALDAAISGEHRDDKAKARDRYRKPRETLEFLGFQSNMTVVEVWPGTGWYTQVLAPALKDAGVFYAAQYSTNPRYGYQRRYFGGFLTTLGENPNLYRQVKVTHLSLPYQLTIAPPGSADMVVTFRNVHNWVSEGYGSGRYAHLGFQAMYDALKPGGILGIVDHRWPDAADEDPLAENGYISRERTVALAEAAGFVLAGESGILRNPKDTHDHPQGVWSLPPSLASGDADGEKYLAIGESDRFLLKFKKPDE
jgi:predicted methyltransferase